MEHNRHAALWLTGIMVAVFALQQLSPMVTQNFVLLSADAWSRPWILLTSIFLHGGITHLLFNGFGLAMFGSILEEHVGTKKFLAVFFGAGLAASVAVTFFYPAVLGASGAIFGVIGALAVLRPMLTVYVYYIPMPLYMAAIAWAALDFFGFATGVSMTGGSVANIGHLAGLATGLGAGLMLRGRKPFMAGSGKKSSFVTAEEFDKWEEEHMRKKP